MNVPVLCFVTAELATRLYQNMTQKEDPIIEENSFKDKPSAILRHHKGRKGNKVLWDVTYKLDVSTGQRLNDLIKVSDPNEIIYLLGGSFPFGQNLKDDETLAYFLHQLRPNAQVINLAKPAMGPHFALEQVKSVMGKITTTDNIPKSFYYFLIDDHIGRSIGDLQHYTHLKDSTYFPLSENGIALKKSTTFAHAFSLRDIFFPLFKKSHLLRLLNFNPPIGKRESMSKKDILHYCLLIKEMRDNSLPSPFKAVFLPDQGLIYHKLNPCLKEHGIQQLNLTHAFSAKASSLPDGELFPDYHPRPKYHKTLAPLILRNAP